ncbi:FkbM family methyltransferase [Halomonas campisalis]|uniref:FkbM family methyltransferase n=1 Tax=Billgrantia campisalis TaxID=74661 RepID=A0ABS9P8V4_9GAMM|nr:FkbM family methyltransferase [Halomonas campisalis]MCG6657525.1 FkbM family methyltransferase [Halomonas campisalis]MDR5863128.1 FkbM family methyltransferase [Halomonas campisalis]
MPLVTPLRRGYGLARSLLVYWRPGRQRALRRLYADFIDPGDLVFDIGAHLGDRTAAFAGLGARVVALEPQPALYRWLTRLVGRHATVTLLPVAAGAHPGEAELAISRATPTVSTLAHGWRQAIGERNPGFRQVRWEERLRVPVTTLDALIAEHGVPRFCKIDVEGFEAEVLAGLSQPLAGVSVEFVAGALEVADACVARLATLGDYRYNAIAGEGRRLRWPDWRSPAATRAWLASGADGLASGDLYARLDSPHPRRQTDA